MNNTLDLRGMHLPIVTPFKDDESRSIDEPSLRKLVNYLIDEQKASSIIPCGTTGEVPTLSTEEHKQVIDIVVDEVRGRVPVIAGTGSNNTAHAIEMTNYAKKAGAAATLQVSPYYNRPSQEGIFEHFKAIDEACGIPMIIYNIPMRTGRNIEPKTLIKLWKELPSVIGLKDACNDNFQTEEVLMATRSSSKPFYVLTGEDRNTYATLCLGGHGVIAAVGHVLGREFADMCSLMLKRTDPAYQNKALDIHFHSIEMVKNLFMEPNPAPVKSALHMMGVLPNDVVRLPLLSTSPKGKEIIRESLSKMGKIPA